MVKLNIDPSKFEFTTKNFMDNFNINEKVISTKGLHLSFFFEDEEPHLLIENRDLDAYFYKEYKFESNLGLIFFLQKLSLNSTIITLLSNDILASVINEILGSGTFTSNLVIDQSTDRILTVTPTSTDLVNWKKILETINEVFRSLEEKPLYLTTSTGLGVSIKMNDDVDWDVLRVVPQTASSISILRDTAREEIPLRGYDENEILAIFKEKLQIIIDPSISKNPPLVRD